MHPSLALLPPSPDTAPICPHFGICGGCHMQDVSYPRQKEAKDAWLKQLFQPVLDSKTSWKPFLASTQMYPVYFRNKTRFSFTGENGRIYASRHRLEDEVGEIVMRECYIQSEISTKIAQFTGAFASEQGWKLYDASVNAGWLKHILIREGKQTGEMLVGLVTTHGNDSSIHDWATTLRETFPTISSVYHITTEGRDNLNFTDKLLLGEPVIHEKIGEYTFQISPHAFFQTNSEMVETLYEAIKGSLPNQPLSSIWDLYAGSATIGIYIHDRAEKIVSIENNPQNIIDARWNLEHNQITNLTIHPYTVEEACTSSFIAEHGKPEVVIVDPPRAGLSEKTRDILAGLRPEHLIYVSCNPITCLRDTRDLLRRGYQLTSVQGIDMFPHTLHCEMLTTFERI